jgi:hypothetical protein
MPDFEGSVEFESDIETESEETTDENVNNQVEDTETESQGQPESEAEDTSQSQETDKTDKGTRLDPDPMSQANQLRANAEKRLREMESFMSDPAAVKRYLEELEAENGQHKGNEVEAIDPNKIETVEDLRKYASYLESKTTKEIDALKRESQQRDQVAQVKETGTRIASEIESVQSKYPQLRELNPDGSKNPDFDLELDREIGQLYDYLDFDPQSQTYRGKVSFAKVAESFMKMAKRGEASGSRKAQTIVQDRRLGRAQSGTVAKSSGPDESSMSASQLIASRMTRASRR